MPHTRFVRSFASLLFAVAATQAVARAQCTEVWSPDLSVAGANGAVWDAVAWDPDGAGPQPERVVVAGAFDVVADQSLSQLASYDLTTGQWVAVAPLLDSAPSMVLPMPNGDLLVAGTFVATASGTPLNGVARWDGTAWHSLAGGVAGAFGGEVRDLVRMPNGDVVATGSFSSAGGVAANNIARWDGVAWHALAAGIDFGGGKDLAVEANGDLIVTGLFQNAGGQPAVNIARWDGAAWSAVLPNGLPFIEDVATRANGDVLIAGGGALFRWDGVNLSVMQALQASDRIEEVVVQANGDIVIAGDFFWLNGLPVQNIARWDGTTWRSFGSGVEGDVLSIAFLSSGEMVAAGDFSKAGSAAATRIARWDGSSWHAMASVGGGEVRAMLLDPQRGLIVARSRVVIGGAESSIYSESGGVLLDRANGIIHALEFGPNGDLFAGGSFDTVDGVSAIGIARFDGTSWHGVGGGVQNGTATVGSMAQMPNGDLVIGGSFNVVGGINATHIARWNGSTWSAITGLPHGASAMKVLANGDLVVIGSFGGAARVSRWNGFWLTLNTTFVASAALALDEAANGDIYVGGAFSTLGTTSAENIARWDGTSWFPLGSGVSGTTGLNGVRAVAAMPNGDVIVGGNFTMAGGIPVDHIARWDGTSWHAMPSGVGGLQPDVFALLAYPSNKLAVGGSFTVVDGVQVTGLAHWSPCGSSVTSYGAGCAGANGVMQTTALTAPELAEDFASETTGFGSNSVALWGLGLTQVNLPIASVHPAGLPGCDVLSSLEYTTVVLPVAGVASTTFAIPGNASLLGLQLSHQVLQFDFGSPPAPFTIASANGLLLTVGI